MSESIIVERFVTREELPVFLRELADALENGGQDELACIEQFSKLKISIKDEFGQVSLKMKAKADSCAGGELDQDSEGKPKYKALKKRMKSTFRLIFKMLQDEQMPPQEAVDLFIEDSRLMCTYPGKGDEYYAEYLKVTDAFEAAAKAGDVVGVRDCAMEMASQKGRCHAKYD